MAVVLQSSNQLAREHGIKALIYSRSGIGKTSLVATAPRPVMLSAESGLLSLKKENIERLHGVNTPGISYDIAVIQIKTIEDLVAAEVWARTSAEAKQFESICIDSITEIAEVILTNAKKTVKDPRQAYGELLDKALMVIKAFRDLKGKHVVTLAKEERAKDESTGVILAGPSMPGAKLGPALPYLFDEVFNLNMAKDPADGSMYRYLRTQPDLKYDAKDRSGTLLEIEPPNLGYIFNKIMAG